MFKTFEKQFFLIVGVFVFSMASLFFFLSNANIVRGSDGLGYYAYLPAIFIDHDISMSSVIENRGEYYNLTKPYDKAFPTIFLKYNGGYLDKYAIGTAVLILPFFLVAHLISIAGGLQINGFAPMYQLFLEIAGTFYFIAGLFFLRKILARYVNELISYLTIIVLIFSTDLFHYGTVDNAYSHIYSFFLISVLLYLTPTVFKKLSFKLAAIYGLILGLLLIIRPTNAIVFLIPLLYELELGGIKLFIKKRIAFIKQNKYKLIIAIFTFFLPIFIQLLYWKAATGQWIIYSYIGEIFDFRNPQVLNVLFSVRRGFFFWSPVMILSIVGWFLIKKDSPLYKYKIGIISFFVLHIYVISSWWNWWYGMSFGHRAFVETLPILSFSLAYFYQEVFIKRKSKLLKACVVAMTLIFMLLCIYLMVEFWTGHIPINDVTLPQFLHLFGIS